MKSSQELLACTVRVFTVSSHGQWQHLGAVAKSEPFLSVNSAAGSSYAKTHKYGLTESFPLKVALLQFSSLIEIL